MTKKKLVDETGKNLKGGKMDTKKEETKKKLAKLSDYDCPCGTLSAKDILRLLIIGARELESINRRDQSAGHD